MLYGYGWVWVPCVLYGYGLIIDTQGDAGPCAGACAGPCAGACAVQRAFFSFLSFSIFGFFLALIYEILACTKSRAVGRNNKDLNHTNFSQPDICHLSSIFLPVPTCCSC